MENNLSEVSVATDPTRKELQFIKKHLGMSERQVGRQANTIMWLCGMVREAKNRIETLRAAVTSESIKFELDEINKILHPYLPAEGGLSDTKE